jgi:hypothetical protein
MMRSRTAIRLILLAGVLLLPSLAAAQTLAGTVKDASGAVLPGVTVEASSPVLIEKVRSATTDTNGNYVLVNLTPGLYTVTFTLPGFSVVRRENVEVSGNQTISIDADLRVGGIQETITVTGETPVVDVQSTRRVATIDNQTIATLPMARGYGNLLATVPGIQLNSTTSSATQAASFFTSNGGRNNEGTVQLAGMNVGSAFNGGGVAAFSYDVANAAEVQVTVSGGLGEADTGGPAMNLIPREGGNRFSGTAFLSEAGEWSQSTNLTDELRSPPINITQPAGLIHNFDQSFALGGPIKRDRVWFFALLRQTGNASNVLGNNLTTYPNLNAGNPNAWTYVPDRSTNLRGVTGAKQAAFRLTAQLTPRNKVGFYHDYNWACWNSSLVQDEGCRPRGEDWIALGNQNNSPETGTGWDDREKIIQATYSSALTNKMLIDGGYSTFVSTWGGQIVPGSPTNLIPVTEQSNYYGVANFTYRGVTNYTHNDQMPNTWRGAVSYVTGSHSLKFGTQGAYQIAATYNDTVGTTQMTYTFNSLCQLPGEPAPLPAAAGRTCNASNGGVIFPRPVSVSTFIPNYNDDRTAFMAYYVQDSWTMNRFTVNAALRYEWVKSWAPEGENGVVANRFTPAILDPRTESVRGWHDIYPRGGVAWDVMGTGKTSVRVNVGQYPQRANNELPYTVNNPAVARNGFRQQQRTWTDSDGDFVVDCDLSPTAIAAQAGIDQCGPVTGAGLSFGSNTSTRTVNPDILSGWGKRPYDWVFGASVQQEIIPRLSVELGYNRRWWGNFFVDDNLAYSPSDFATGTFTAPAHSLLPGGGNYPFDVRVQRVAARPTQNYYTYASDYGDMNHYFDSFQFTSRARTRWGLTLQGGTTTGRGVRDQCEIEALLPELNVAGPTGNNGRTENCRIEEEWLTALNGLASYTVPKVDVLISAILRSQPGTTPGNSAGSNGNGASLNASYNLTAQQVFNATGVVLPACGATPVATCQSVLSTTLLLQGEVYQKRINNIDMRFAKIFRFGGRRADVGIDLYNIINANTQTGYNQAYGTDGTGLWRPTAIMNARYARFNVTFDF